MRFLRKLAVFVLAAAFACSPSERSVEVDHVLKLSGRCVRVREPMFILRPTSGSGTLYLSRSQSTIDPTVGNLVIGSEIRIHGSWLKSTFEMTTVEIIGSTGLNADVIVSPLFASAWIIGVSQALKWEDSSAAVLRHPELNSDLAEWCAAPSDGLPNVGIRHNAWESRARRTGVPALGRGKLMVCVGWQPLVFTTGIFGCGPCEGVERVPAFTTLENRCVSLRQPLQMIDGGNDGISDLYLSNASHDDDTASARSR